MKFKFKHKKVSPFISYMLLFFIFFALLAVIISIYNGYRADIDNKNLISKLDKSDKEIWDALNQKTYSLSDDKDFTIGLNGIYYQDKLVPCLKATDWWKIKKYDSHLFFGTNEFAVTDNKHYVYFTTVGETKREGVVMDLESIINIIKYTTRNNNYTWYSILNTNSKKESCAISSIIRTNKRTLFYERINSIWHYCSLNKNGFYGTCVKVVGTHDGTFTPDTNPTDKTDAHDKNHKYLKGNIAE